MDPSRFAIRGVQVAVALLIIEIVVFALRSGFGTVLTAVSFIWPGLKLLAGGYYAVIAICIVCAAYGFCCPKKLLPVHSLALVPWLLTLEVMLWGGYFAASITDPSQSRPASEIWIVDTIYFALFVSLWAWLTLFFLRLREWWRVLICGGLQLAFQCACSFIAIMAGMNNWL